MGHEGRQVLILGASSGLGAGIARAFAAAGAQVTGVHLDRRAAGPAVDALVHELSAHGRPARFHNLNAADPANRAAVVQGLAAGPGRVDVLVHSLAFGTLRPLVAPPDGDAPISTARNIEMTLDVMAHSLVYWTQDLVQAGLLGPGGRIYALTSSGGQRALPSYGPVSAAKAALEAHVRQLALELAPRQITVNAIMAGVTDTPALEKIPGADELKARARARNPHGRLTRPEDVAACLVELARPGTHWLTGNVLRVDGGEDACA
jgi:NAD(P)-dependent dehydrogenase (short-subunit alcohol dehydrogenase family)